MLNLIHYFGQLLFYNIVCALCVEFCGTISVII